MRRPLRRRGKRRVAEKAVIGLLADLGQHVPFDAARVEGVEDHVARPPEQPQRAAVRVGDDVPADAIAAMLPARPASQAEMFKEDAAA
jgi:hypothetical protein